MYNTHEAEKVLKDRLKYFVVSEEVSVSMDKIYK